MREAIREGVKEEEKARRQRVEKMIEEGEKRLREIIKEKEEEGEKRKKYGMEKEQYRKAIYDRIQD